MWPVGVTLTFLHHSHTLLLSGVGFTLMDVINDEMRHGKATHDTAEAVDNHTHTKSNFFSTDVHGD